MKLSDFRIGWRALVQEPAYSLVVILGLGIGVAAFLLLAGFVRYSWQYDAHVPDVEHVYVVKQRMNVELKAPWFDLAPLLLHAAAARIPGVVDATGFVPTRPQVNPLAVTVDGRMSKLNSLTVLPGFAQVLGLQALHGDLKAALEQPESFAITEEAAMRLFGTANAVGRSVQSEGQLLRVGAVLRTPPANTTIGFEALTGIGSLIVEKVVRDEMLTGKSVWLGKLLVRVHPDASLPALSASLQQAIDQAPAIQRVAAEQRERLGKLKVMEVALSPLRYAYFDRDVTTSHIMEAGERASPVVVAGLGAVAVLILALAAINYVNLASVRVLRRQREVAMRKVLGAGVRQIVLQLLAEAMLVAMVATAIGLLLAWIALPLFSELVNRKLDGMFSLANIAAALFLGGMLGTLTSVYPAWIAIGVRPALVLAGRPDAESVRGMQLRRVMTVLQAATAMAFAAISMAIAWQTSFAMRASPGFDPAPLLIVDVPEPVKYNDTARSFMTALSAQPGVAGVAVSVDAVGRSMGAMPRELKRPDGGAAAMEMKAVSAGFFEQYRIRAQAGRLFDARLDKEDDPEPLVLNALAAHELGFATPVAALGQTVLLKGYDNKPIAKRVVGIAPELRFQSLRERPRALAYELGTAGATLSVRTLAGPAQVEPLVQALWARYFPHYLLRMHRANDILVANYAEDARMARLLAIATGIALAIAAFGTYVLSAHTVQRRAKEIVMRKLYGAGRADIGLLVVREIGGLTLLACVIGLPLAGVAIERYLSTFVERAPIGYWTMLLALAATLAIALIAVARHTWLAMRMKPSAALRGG